MVVKGQNLMFVKGALRKIFVNFVQHLMTKLDQFINDQQIKILE